MKRRDAVLTVLVSLAAACQPSPPEEPQRVAQAGAPGRVSVEGGLWFDGSGFVPRTAHIEDGLFVDRLSAEADSVIDLDGGYVLPPFGDAHTHMLDGGPQMGAFVEQYEADGIYYVQVLNNLTSGAREHRGSFNRPGALDVTYANGGITSTLGHPFIAYEPRALGMDWREALERADEVRESRVMEGNAYWFVDSLEDLERQWDAILAERPDQLKIYLLRADDPDHPADPNTMGLTGLSPEIASAVVERASAAGLPVWAHVETARDFEIGLDIGVDGFAHLPGYQLGADDDEDEFRLSDEAVARAGAAGVAVTPTVTLIEFYAWDDASRVDRVRAMQEDAIRRLREAGARIVIGTDSYGTTSAQEALTLARGFLEPAEVLDLWSRVTPQSILPDRRIGRLDAGWEASFVVLGGNPLEDIEHAGDVRGGMKQGAWIDGTVPTTISRLLEP